MSGFEPVFIRLIIGAFCHWAKRPVHPKYVDIYKEDIFFYHSVEFLKIT